MPHNPERKVTYNEWLEDLHHEIQHIYKFIQQFNNASGYRILDMDLNDFEHLAYQNSTIHTHEQRRYYFRSDDEGEDDDAIENNSELLY